MRLDGSQLSFSKPLPLLNSANIVSCISFQKNNRGHWFVLTERSETKKLVPFMDKKTVLDDSCIYLGSYRNGNYVGMDLSDKATIPMVASLQWTRITPISISLMQEDWHVDLISKGHALLVWHERNRFCGLCGSPCKKTRMGLSIKCVGAGGGAGGVGCLASGSESVTSPLNSQYPRTDPSVIAFLTTADNEYCLLVRGKNYPPGFYAAVSGFVDPGEGLETAVRREVWEETGIELDATASQIKYHSSLSWPFPSTLMISFWVTLPQSITPSSPIFPIDKNEIDGHVWLSKSQVKEIFLSPPKASQQSVKLPKDLSLVSHMLKIWYQKNSKI